MCCHLVAECERDVGARLGRVEVNEGEGDGRLNLGVGVGEASRHVVHK